MGTYWDAFLAEHVNLQPSVCSLLPRELLEKYHKWLVKQYKIERERCSVCNAKWETQDGDKI